MKATPNKSPEPTSLALAVPLSWFTSRVGGFVRPHGVKLFLRDIVYSYMKIQYVVLALLASGAVLFASFVTPYDKSKPPALPLSDAYQLAVAALGSATNQFHCLSAGIEEFGGGRWLFTFYSTNTPPKTKFVVVEFSGAASVADVYAR